MIQHATHYKQKVPNGPFSQSWSQFLSCVHDDFVGVYLSLNGQLLTNSSDFLITEIGDRIDGGGVGEALLCYTDNIQCCNNTSVNTERWFKLGQGDNIGDESDAGDFYISRGLGVVRLHRRNNTFPTGLFCCEVPDATSTSQTLCVNIGELLSLMNEDH